MTWPDAYHLIPCRQDFNLTKIRRADTAAQICVVLQLSPERRNTLQILAQRNAIGV